MELLIDQGADILFVSRYLGHKDIRTTANTYGHLFPQRGEETAKKLGETMAAAEVAYREAKILPLDASKTS